MFDTISHNDVIQGSQETLTNISQETLTNNLLSLFFFILTMGTISKGFAVFIILIIAISGLSLLTIKPIFAQAIAKPSVPEFTLKYVDNSYDVPATYTTTIDPFNGKEYQTKSGGFHVENKTLVLTIKNQPFTPYTFSDGGTIKEVALHYKIHCKGHFGDDWSSDSIWVDAGTDYSIKTYFLSETYGALSGLSSGDKVDFQIQAWIGYYTFIPDPLRSGFYNEGTLEPTVLKESGWSTIQTITIAEGSTSISSPNPTPTSTQNPTPTLTVPEFSWLMILPLFVSILSIAITFKLRRLAK